MGGFLFHVKESREPRYVVQGISVHGKVLPESHTIKELLIGLLLYVTGTWSPFTQGGVGYKSP